LSSASATIRVRSRVFMIGWALFIQAT
jgi:hypothetical protein